MTALLQFVFSSPWTFGGTVFLMLWAGVCLSIPAERLKRTTHNNFFGTQKGSEDE